MTIIAVETTRLDAHPGLVFVELHDSSQLIGLGETYFGAAAVEAWIHETAAPLLLGREPSELGSGRGLLEGYVGYGGSGVETRGRSAVDIALWDLWARAHDLPLHDALGGRIRPVVRTYNTCAGPGYARGTEYRGTSSSGLGAGPLEDLVAATDRPVELARDLLGEGIGAMKVWPFDRFAEADRGRSIGAHDLELGMAPLRKIRDAIGDGMDLIVELHAMWNARSAERILRRLEDIDPLFVEDPIRPDDALAFRRLARTTAVPIATGETLAGTLPYRELLRNGAIDMAIVDPAWCGGITTVLDIASLAASFGATVTMHDCTGPVNLAVATHLAVHLPNVWIQESVRAFYRGWYEELATGFPAVSSGYIAPGSGIGHGVALRPDIRARNDIHVRRSDHR
ncbi:MAG: mandelate racemase/muconate lactonizing enzyme family protein [Chloroflexota bacterium]|nr:mandelate racemase/muconate lactonizing enzyme family protein [Chloroflexota bacterium]